MGNAGAGWKLGSEQLLRDRLEDLLVARPRFKEFAIGYPLLLLGLHMRSSTASLTPPSLFKGEGDRALGEGWSLLIAIGMIGPISVVNTFCHLHSPLYLALWRTANGIVLGSAIGLALLGLVSLRAKRSNLSEITDRHAPSGRSR